MQFQDLWLPVNYRADREEKTAHSGIRGIPPEHGGKKIISCIRNPYDHYVSMYEFPYWKKDFPVDINEILKLFPDYPDLSFKDFLNFINNICIKPERRMIQSKLDIGHLTFKFIKMYFNNSAEIFQKIGRNNPDHAGRKLDMPDIIFLHAENLNLELYQSLLGFGYREEDIAFILDEKKIYPGNSKRKAEQKWGSYYTEELLEYVKRRERYLFGLFPEYGDALK